MRVIVTRPDQDARRWVQGLRGRGIDALALPLISLHGVADTAAVRAAWRNQGAYAALMFVSRSAVEFFFAARPTDDLVVGAAPVLRARTWATGPGTTAALLRLGVDAALIDAPAADSQQFDTEALWAVVGLRVQPGDRVLIVRGADRAADVLAGGDGAQAGQGRDWLARRLLQAGAQVEFLAVYWRSMPVFDAGQLRLAREAATDGSVWLFTSSQALANLRHWLPLQDWSAARAVATHPRIAAAARAAGFGVVWASRPGLSDIVASIESSA